MMVVRRPAKQRIAKQRIAKQRRPTFLSYLWSKFKLVAGVISGTVIVVGGVVVVGLLTLPELDRPINLVWLDRQDSQRVVLLALRPHRPAAYWFEFSPGLTTPALGSDQPLEVAQLAGHFARYDTFVGPEPGPAALATTGSLGPAAGHFTIAGFSAALTILLDDVMVADQLPAGPNKLQLWWWLVSHSAALVGQGTDWQQLWAWSGFLFQLSSDRLFAPTIEDWSDWADHQLSLRRPTKLSCQVAVINATQTSGLATAMTNLLESNQLSVIRVGNAPEPNGQTRLVTAEQGRCRQEVQLLQAALPISTAATTDQPTADRYRAPLVLFLGSEVEQAWLGLLAAPRTVRGQ